MFFDLFFGLHRHLRHIHIYIYIYGVWQGPAPGSALRFSFMFLDYRFHISFIFPLCFLYVSHYFPITPSIGLHQSFLLFLGWRVPLHFFYVPTYFLCISYGFRTFSLSFGWISWFSSFFSGEKLHFHLENVGKWPHFHHIFSTSIKKFDHINFLRLLNLVKRLAAPLPMWKLS